MPAVSAAQQRAMYAAAEGRSKLGIPKKVGEEFVSKDSAFLGSLQRFAKGFLQWVMEEEGEAEHAEDAERKSLYVSRVLLNAQDVIDWAKAQGFGQTLSPDDMHVTVAFSRTPVDWAEAGDSIDALQFEGGDRSVEKLDDKGAIVLRFDAAELSDRWQQFRDAGASWDWPGYKPHITLTYSGDGAPDLSTIKSYDGVLRFGPEKYSEVVEDWEKKIDEKKIAGANDMALDRNSLRRYDKEGRLHVERSNISKANICEYLGQEIPDFEALGLDPAKRYRLLRHPDELEKAADTFNNLPILSRHVPVSAQDHQPDLVIGSTGTDAEFADPFLSNSLVFWTADSIGDIESEDKKELSSAYRYRADMTPGTFRGEPYDGVMRDIIGNHVALVTEGRAGPDVVVGDESIPTRKKEIDMPKMVLSRKAAVAKGAIIAFLQPKLAADAKIDVTPLLAGVTHKNFKDKKSGIVAGIKERVKGKLAQDANVEDVTKLLDALENVEEIEASDDIDDANGVPDDKTMDADLPKGKEAILSFLKGKLSDEDCAKVGTMFGQDEEDDEAERKKREAGASDKDVPEPAVTKAALDAAITSAVNKAKADAVTTQREIRDAERAVRPYVGELAMAHDSAEGVYRTALGAMGIKVEGVHSSALATILSLQPLPGARKSPTPVAMDAAGVKGFAERFPDAARILKI